MTGVNLDNLEALKRRRAVGRDPRGGGARRGAGDDAGGAPVSATYSITTRTGRSLAARSRRTGRILPIDNVDDAMRVAKIAARRMEAVIVVTRTIVEGSDARSAVIARVGSAHRLREVPVPIGPAASEELDDLDGVA